MAYRVDPLALERERARLAEQTRELEARWTDTFWREVAPGRGVAPPGSSARSGSDLEAEVTRLARRLEVLTALERDAAQILTDWESPPPLADEHVGLIGPRFLITPWERASFERTVAQIGEAAEREASGLPIGVRGRMRRTRHGAFLIMRLVTTVAPGVPDLVVRHEGMLDEVRKLLGSKHDIQLGIDRFDGVFAIEGDETTARAVLDAEVRAALLRMGERAAVDVRVGSGHASVGDHTSAGEKPDARWARDAIGVARALHRAPARPLRAVP